MSFRLFLRDARQHVHDGVVSIGSDNGTLFRTARPNLSRCLLSTRYAFPRYSQLRLPGRLSSTGVQTRRAVIFADTTLNGTRSAASRVLTANRIILYSDTWNVARNAFEGALCIIFVQERSFRFSPKERRDSRDVSLRNRSRGGCRYRNRYPLSTFIRFFFLLAKAVLNVKPFQSLHLTLFTARARKYRPHVDKGLYALNKREKERTRETDYLTI